MSAQVEPVGPNAGPIPDGSSAQPRHERERRPGSFVRLAAGIGGLLVLAVTVAVLSLLDHPVVFGRWEGTWAIQMMHGPGPALPLEIRGGGYISAPSRYYALINLGSYTAEWLGWSLTAVRLPVLVAGAVAVLLFFVVARRAFGFWPGLVSALALALNETFVVLWHQFIVVMISMACLLLVVERYQLLERVGHGSRAARWVVPTLALAFVALLLHYGPGRLCGGAVIAFWAAHAGRQALQARRAGGTVNRAPLLGLAVFVVLVVVVAVLMDVRNARYLLAPHELLVTPRSEFIRSADQAGSVFENLLIVLQALVRPLDLAPEHFAEFGTDIIVDFRYYLLPASILPLVLLGVGVLVGQARRSKDAQLTLWLLAVTLISPMFSSGTSISSYRLFYALLPLSLCVAAGVGWLLGRRSPIVRWGCVALCFAVLASQAITVRNEVGRHQAFVDDLVRRWSPGIGVRIFEGSSARRAISADEEFTSGVNGSYRHYLEAGGVPALVAAHQIRSRFPQSTDPSEATVIALNGAVQRDDDTGPVKLVFFLRELGVSAALFDPQLQRIRGAGPGRPSHVVATNEASAGAARRQLEALGLRVRVREYRPPR